MHFANGPSCSHLQLAAVSSRWRLSSGGPRSTAAAASIPSPFRSAFARRRGHPGLVHARQQSASARAPLVRRRRRRRRRRVRAKPPPRAYSARVVEPSKPERKALPTPTGEPALGRARRRARRSRGGGDAVAAVDGIGQTSAASARTRNWGGGAFLSSRLLTGRSALLFGAPSKKRQCSLEDGGSDEASPPSCVLRRAALQVPWRVRARARAAARSVGRARRRAAHPAATTGRPPSDAHRQPPATPEDDKIVGDQQAVGPGRMRRASAPLRPRSDPPPQPRVAQTRRRRRRRYALAARARHSESAATAADVGADARRARAGTLEEQMIGGQAAAGGRRRRGGS